MLGTVAHLRFSACNEEDRCWEAESGFSANPKDLAAEVHICLTGDERKDSGEDCSTPSYVGAIELTSGYRRAVRNLRTLSEIPHNEALPLQQPTDL